MDPLQSSTAGGCHLRRDPRPTIERVFRRERFDARSFVLSAKTSGVQRFKGGRERRFLQQPLPRPGVWHGPPTARASSAAGLPRRGARTTTSVCRSNYAPTPRPWPRRRARQLRADVPAERVGAGGSRARRRSAAALRGGRHTTPPPRRDCLLALLRSGPVLPLSVLSRVTRSVPSSLVVWHALTLVSRNERKRHFNSLCFRVAAFVFYY